MPGHRHQADAHPDVEDHHEREHRRQAGADEIAVAVARLARRDHDAPEDDHVEAEDQRRADEAHLLADVGEDEIGVALGQESELRLRAGEKTLTPNAAGADRDFRLDHVVGRALDVGSGATKATKRLRW